ncbi:MAG: hypothetical protein PHG19_06080 [Anaerotignum sp.]|nr:hypothetical protein [Anaerotignum sp.]
MGGKEMLVIFFGISYLIQAVLHGFGCPYLVNKKYRNADFRKQYQKGLVFPYAFLGVGWFILGFIFRTLEDENIFLYCICLVSIAAMPLYLIKKNEQKFLPEDQEE